VKISPTRAQDIRQDYAEYLDGHEWMSYLDYLEARCARQEATLYASAAIGLAAMGAFLLLWGVFR
jgi:hypothetical protein